MSHPFMDAETPEMQKAAAMADSIAQQIHDYRTQLTPVVEAARAHWNGTSRPIFEQKYAEWDGAITRFLTELARLGAATNASAVAYLSANDEAMGAIKATEGAGAPLGGALGGPVAV